MQLYADRTAIGPKPKALIACSVHPVLLRLPLRGCRYLINNEHTSVGFLSIGNVESRELLIRDEATLIHRFNHGSTVDV